ncbi:hypothetical protein LJC23_06740 [Desulfovibrio sp. OttesenSCG-928-I05]|nr:hypothetical protein [Desulfovibrio sp. OttesenSCG-928-I05]
MIDAIRTATDMLVNDFDNPALSALKERLNLSRPIFEAHVPTEEEGAGSADVLKDNIEVILDFYERFCRRMELMMEHSPQYAFISFMGP